MLNGGDFGDIPEQSGNAVEFTVEIGRAGEHLLENFQWPAVVRHHEGSGRIAAESDGFHRQRPNVDSDEGHGDE